MKSINEFEEGKAVDEAGLRRFTEAMNAKLAKKRDEGRGGWHCNPSVYGDRGTSVERLKEMLHDHIKKGDMVDIANFAMMIWNREHPEGK